MKRLFAFVLLLVAIVTVFPVRARAAEDREWYVRTAHVIDLIHGVKETDDQDFFAGCEPRSGQVVIVLTQTVRSLVDGGELPVVIAVDTQSRRFVVRGSMNDELGAPVGIIRLDADDPLLDWMAGGYSLRLTVLDVLDESVSLQGSARVVRSFIAACRK